MNVAFGLATALMAIVSSLPKVIKEVKIAKESTYVMSFHQMLSHFSQNENALTCAICIDLVTDIDEFLTSDTTEDQIVQFVEQVAMSDHTCKWLSRK